jgi:hypothetical protein
VVDDGLAGWPHHQRLLQLLATTLGHQRQLRCKTLNMLSLLQGLDMWHKGVGVRHDRVYLCLLSCRLLCKLLLEVCADAAGNCGMFSPL